MIIVADSGSTKTAWACVMKENVVYFSTIGMNPYFVTKESIVQELKAHFPAQCSTADVTEIHFYGSGCARKDKQQFVAETLNDFFPKATVEVQSDLVGAAVACYGQEKGIIAILGTGMNIGYWDGFQLTTPIPSLGYILGDAGSGTALGKLLIKRIFEKKMSSKTTDAFFEEYHLSVADVLDKLYAQPRPNTFLASFVPFIAKHRSNDDVQNLIFDVFSAFVCDYAEDVSQEFSANKISFVGSIAQVFQCELVVVLQQHNLECTTICANPIEAMVSRVKR